MARIIQVPDGSASLGVYLVEYDEDQWFRYTAEDHQFCYDTWLKKAVPTEARRVCLRLIPDPIFPRHADKPLPYVYWQQDIVREANKTFKVHYAKVSLQLDDFIDSIDVKTRSEIERYMCAYPRGTTYKVWSEHENTEIKVLLQGKVNK